MKLAALISRVALSGACGPIRPNPAKHAQATDYRCGDATVRVYKDTGIETNGLQFNHGGIRFDAHGWVTAGHWQRSAGYIDGKHAITLKETRFAMRDGQLMTAKWRPKAF